jgi:hypothetical protein
VVVTAAAAAVTTVAFTTTAVSAVSAVTAIALLRLWLLAAAATERQIEESCLFAITVLKVVLRIIVTFLEENN